MRSLPQPRYSRTRTIQRIFRSIINLFSTGYVSDSSAFTHRTVLDKSNNRTKIRLSRFTRKPTPRTTVVNKLGNKLIDELIVNDDTLISNVVRNEISNLTNSNNLNKMKSRKKINWFRLWKHHNSNNKLDIII